MSDYSTRYMSIGGIAIQVVGLDELSEPEPKPGPTLPVGVLFILHGRLGNAKQPYLKRIANLVLTKASSRPNERGRELVVVILDQRNHGDRTVEPERNKGWKDEGQVDRLADGQADPESLDNITHLHDMYSLYTGTVHDVSFLITHLEPLLFRHDERTVDKWMVAGVSLGGHAAWHIGSHDPRVSLVIPIIGSPSYLTLFNHRATHLGVRLAPPYLPESLKREMQRAQPTIEAFKGKDVLVLSGADDPLVPFTESGSKEFTDRLENAGVCRSLRVWVQPNTGHTVTVEMVDRIKDFIWANGVQHESGARSNL